MFGLMEVAALSGSCLILLLVLLSYIYFLVPARSHLASSQEERARLQSNIRKSDEIVHTGRTTQATVEKIAKSLDSFESDALARADQGRMTLYGELNELIGKNALRNTSGPTYTALAAAGAKTNTLQSTSTKWQSVYPGIGVAVTVEGPYQNIRHFIRDIESTRQFIIINQVELQRASESSNTPAGSAPGAGSRGSLVSLELNMATYFQRSTSENAAAEGGPN
jgi:Tfp pilus assembly protein PilO